MATPALLPCHALAHLCDPCTWSYLHQCVCMAAPSTRATPPRAQLCSVPAQSGSEQVIRAVPTFPPLSLLSLPDSTGSRVGRRLRQCRGVPLCHPSSCPSTSNSSPAPTPQKPTVAHPREGGSSASLSFGEGRQAVRCRKASSGAGQDIGTVPLGRRRVFGGNNQLCFTGSGWWDRALRPLENGTGSQPGCSD